MAVKFKGPDLISQWICQENCDSVLTLQILGMDSQKSFQISDSCEWLPIYYIQTQVNPESRLVNSNSESMGKLSIYMKAQLDECKLL